MATFAISRLSVAGFLRAIRVAVRVDMTAGISTTAMLLLWMIWH